MPSNENLVSSRLCTYHDLKAITIIRDFVSKTGQFFGADDKEMHHLELMAEEAAGFIIDALTPDKETLFEIDAKPIDGGLCFYFHSKGIPVDEQNLPIYDSQNPEDSIDGLPFFLLESLSDAMQFKNEGKDGWVLIFEKRFRRFESPQQLATIDEETIKRCAKERLKISIADATDAYDITKLTYLTYRYSYAKSVFYYRKELEDALESGKIIAFVAKNAKGEVVVSSAYLRSDHCDAIAEAGMLMSKPEYRKNSALLLIARKQEKFIRANNNGLCITNTMLVTTHTRSQRLVKHFGFFPTALRISVHDKADFIGIDSDNEHRESLLYALNIACELEPTTIFLPKSHLQITQNLLEEFKHITFSTDEINSELKISKFSVEKHLNEKFAIITVDVVAQDWVESLKHHIKEVEDDGIITTFIHMPTDKELPKNFEEKMCAMGLFYSGIMIKTKTKWELLYTRLRGQRVNFDSIKLDDKKAIELKEYIYQRFIDVAL